MCRKSWMQCAGSKWSPAVPAARGVYGIYEMLRVLGTTLSLQRPQGQDHHIFVKFATSGACRGSQVDLKLSACAGRIRELRRADCESQMRRVLVSHRHWFAGSQRHGGVSSGGLLHDGLQYYLQGCGLS